MPWPARQGALPPQRYSAPSLEVHGEPCVAGPGSGAKISAQRGVGVVMLWVRVAFPEYHPGRILYIRNIFCIVHICMYIKLNIYTHMYTYIYIYLKIYMYIYIYTYVYLCVYF